MHFKTVANISSKTCKDAQKSTRKSSAPLKYQLYNTVLNRLYNANLACFSRRIICKSGYSGGCADSQYSSKAQN